MKKISLRTVRNVSALVAVVGGLACAFGAWWAPARFYEAYLWAFLVITGIGLGCLALIMLQHLVGGRWSRATRRLLEAAAWPLVITPLLALPLAFATESLYPWAAASSWADDPLLARKSAYLNLPFFRLRAAVYLGGWALLTGLLTRWSRRAGRGDQRGSGKAGRRLRGFAAVGLVFYVLSVTFASVDWMMSLDPHWFSSIYGVIVIAGQGTAGFCVAILSLYWLRHRPALREIAVPPVFHDLGNLLLAAVTFWIYVSFSQFLIIWSGNLAEEVPWYLARSRGGWEGLIVVLVAVHFVLPFGLLLSRKVKRAPALLAGVATLVAWAHVLDLFWLVMPSRRPTLFVHWLDVVTLVTLAAVWKAFASWRLATARLITPSEHRKGATRARLESTRTPV